MPSMRLQPIACDRIRSRLWRAERRLRTWTRDLGFRPSLQPQEIEAMFFPLDLHRRSASREGRRTRRSAGRSRLPSVERLEDYLLLTVFTVINTNDSGLGSLRRAMNDANAD